MARKVAEREEDIRNLKASVEELQALVEQAEEERSSLEERLIALEATHESRLADLEATASLVKTILEAGVPKGSPMEPTARIAILESRFEKLKAATVSGLRKSEAQISQWNAFNANPQVQAMKKKLGI